MWFSNNRILSSLVHSCLYQSFLNISYLDNMFHISKYSYEDSKCILYFQISTLNIVDHHVELVNKSYGKIWASNLLKCWGNCPPPHFSDIGVPLLFRKSHILPPGFFCGLKPVCSQFFLKYRLKPCLFIFMAHLGLELKYHSDL